MSSRAGPNKKKSVYCYEFETGKYFMKFSGLRIMARSLNLNNAQLIRRRLDKNIPSNVKIDGIDCKLNLKSKPLP